MQLNVSVPFGKFPLSLFQACNCDVVAYIAFHCSFSFFLPSFSLEITARSIKWDGFLLCKMLKSENVKYFCSYADLFTLTIKIIKECFCWYSWDFTPVLYIDIKDKIVNNTLLSKEVGSFRYIDSLFSNIVSSHIF